MFFKLKTISCAVSLAASVALLAGCADSGEATGSSGSSDIIETGAATDANSGSQLVRLQTSRWVMKHR